VVQVALVTGANRGIGLEVVRQLAGPDRAVILASRDVAKGRKAAEALHQSGVKGSVTVCQLDVSDEASRRAAVEFVRREFGRLDILVNNAGIFIDDGVPALALDLERLSATLETNLYGPLRLCQAFIPMMERQNYGRIVNVSSEMGQFENMGRGSAAYRLSKTALNALTVILAKEARSRNIKINAACPGWVRTDMGGPNAELSLAEGADTIVWLAALPSSGPTGGFFRKRRPIAW
jgi:NAD(P)-dependent dehydrogenase (short-subunit alcohol dehydrogenase family)